MSAPLVIADETTATGFRLAGARTLVPPAGSVTALFTEACAGAELVLLTAELARDLPRQLLEQALLTTPPLLVLIADSGGRVAPPDLARLLRSTLGVDT